MFHLFFYCCLKHTLNTSENREKKKQAYGEKLNKKLTLNARLSNETL